MDLTGLKITQSHLQKTPQHVRLLAVTKSFNLSTTQALIESGVEMIGENRIELAIKKFPHLPPVEKHFIGQIQSKKIKKIVQWFDVIESVDSNEHLLKIDLAAKNLNKLIHVFLQFNISNEPQKAGYCLDQIKEIEDIFPKIHHIHVKGVMGMASDSLDHSLIRGQFRKLREIRDRLKKISPSISELSMGMSSDYLMAIEEGATIVRIGTKLIENT